MQADFALPIVNKKVSEIYGIDAGSDRETLSEEIKQINDQLQDHAKRMLSDYLRKTRHSRRKSSTSGNSGSTGKDSVRERSIDQVCDLLHVAAMSQMIND